MNCTMKNLNRSKSCGDLMDLDVVVGRNIHEPTDVVGVSIKDPAAGKAQVVQANSDDKANVVEGVSIQEHATVGTAQRQTS